MCVLQVLEQEQLEECYQGAQCAHMRMCGPANSHIMEAFIRTLPSTHTHKTNKKFHEPANYSAQLKVKKANCITQSRWIGRTTEPAELEQGTNTHTFSGGKCGKRQSYS